MFNVILLSVSKVTYRADATRAGKRVDEVLPMLKTLDQDDSREWIQCVNEAVVYACIEMIEEDEHEHQAPGTTIDPTSKQTYARSEGKWYSYFNNSILLPLFTTTTCICLFTCWINCCPGA